MNIPWRFQRPSILLDRRDEAAGASPRQTSACRFTQALYQFTLQSPDTDQLYAKASAFLLYIRSSAGALVPLSAVASLVPTLGPLSVNHSGQLPSVTISFNLKPGVAIGDALTQITSLARTELPATISASFQGTAQAFQESLRGMGFLLLLTVFIIYMILGILYESFIHPLTILSALPFAGFGALLTLVAFRTELTISDHQTFFRATKSFPETCLVREEFPYKGPEIAAPPSAHSVSKGQ